MLPFWRLYFENLYFNAVVSSLILKHPGYLLVYKSYFSKLVIFLLRGKTQTEL